MKKWKIILSIVLALLIIPVAAGAIYVNFVLDKVTVSDEEFGKDFDLNINTNLENSNVKNIALFGVDCRTADYKGCRSDVMMVLSYDQKNNDAIVTSIARDTYVEIGEHGFDKINHAYAFGGPELAIQTINRTFDLDIGDYVTVDFWAVEKIIDALGGVEIEVKSEELTQINICIDELNNVSPTGNVASHVHSAGKQILSGRQAVAYMRIRYVGDGDFERMSRQRLVMSVALEGIKDSSLTQLIDVATSLLSTVRTNLSKGEIVGLLTKVVSKGIPTLEQYQIPERDKAIGTKIDGIYYFVPHSLLENVQNLHKMIYGNEAYQPSDIVRTMSDKIEAKLNQTGY